MTFTPENRIRFEEIVRCYPETERRAAMLPALWLAQEQEGFIEPAMMEHIGGLLGVSPAEVLETASYYNMFRLEPCGRHQLQVCTNLSCALRGARGVVDWLRERLGVEVGETTSDGLVTLSAVQCLGSCDTAPMMQVDDRYEEHLTGEKLARILESLS